MKNTYDAMFKANTGVIILTLILLLIALVTVMAMALTSAWHNERVLSELLRVETVSHQQTSNVLNQITKPDEK